MRLLIIVFVAAAIAALVSSLPSKQSMTNGYTLQSEETANDPPADSLGNGEVRHSSPHENPDRWSWLWKALNQVIVFALAGWACGRLMSTFKRWIALGLGVLFLFNFVLVVTGLVEISVNWENIAGIFQTVKRIIIGVGFVEFLAFLLGIWAGVAKPLRFERRQEALATR